MSIIIVRHGETALNRARVLQPADTPLSAHGQAQAAAVARRLAEQPVAAIISSDLPRALATAEAIAAATGAAIETTPLLQERNFGDLRGQPWDSFAFDPLTMQAAPPGGESARAFRDRVALAFAHIVQRREAIGGDIVVVTHGLVIRELLESHCELSSEQAGILHIANTSVSTIAAQPPYTVSPIDCIRHLAYLAGDGRALHGG